MIPIRKEKKPVERLVEKDVKVLLSRVESK